MPCGSSADQGAVRRELAKHRLVAVNEFFHCH
jgi:hypothetical protein